MAIGPRELYDGFWAKQITNKELCEDLRLRIDRAIFNEMIREGEKDEGRYLQRFSPIRQDRPTQK